MKQKHGFEVMRICRVLQENSRPGTGAAPAHLIESMPVVLSESRLLNKLHNGKTAASSKRTKRLIHKAVKETLSVIHPRGIYRIRPLPGPIDRIGVRKNASFTSKFLSRILRDSDSMVVFVITIGKEIDERIQYNITKNPSYGFILDYVAAAAAEEAAEILQQFIRETLPDDKTVTYRYSPGYCDWPLSEQKQLFREIPHEKIGVNLSDSCLMSPQKSVSGVFGVCSAELGIKSINHCTMCKKKNCPYRRK